jgi:transcriptional regulator with XRE-family HTH domain
VSVTALTAGALLREARERANLSQAALGRRAGVTQSVVSAYESGGRQPSLPTLRRLIEATGHDLGVRISPAPHGCAADWTCGPASA